MYLKLKTQMKSETRSKCSQGARRRVTDKGNLPPEACMAQFFRNNDNKTDLFNFLADKIVERWKVIIEMLSS